VSGAPEGGQAPAEMPETAGGEQAARTAAHTQAYPLPMRDAVAAAAGRAKASRPVVDTPVVGARSAGGAAVALMP
jgi:hypothetical protein